MKELEIFIDMDEVAYNLSNEVRKVVNKEFNTSYVEGYNQSYWWQDYNIERSYFEKVLHRKGMFLDGKPIKDSIEYINKLHEEGFQIYILTCPTHSSEYCYKEKVEWIEKYLPWLDIDKNFIATGNKGLLAKSNRILIDDSLHNLKSFCNEGGVSIAFGNYGWNKEYDGFHCYKWCEVYEMIHLMNDIKVECEGKRGECVE